MKLSEAKNIQKFITDAGKSFDVKDDKGTVMYHLSRYAVWGDAGKGKAEVIDTDDNLAALKKRNGLSDDVKIVNIKMYD